MPFKMHKIIIIKTKCVPTVPKIFRSVTRKTLFLLFGLVMGELVDSYYAKELGQYKKAFGKYTHVALNWQYASCAQTGQ